MYPEPVLLLAFAYLPHFLALLNLSPWRQLEQLEKPGHHLVCFLDMYPSVIDSSRMAIMTVAKSKSQKNVWVTGMSAISGIDGLTRSAGTTMV